MELAVKIVGILVSLFALYKIIIEVVVSRSSKRRDEYEFSKQFISDLDNESIHRLTLEKGFLALTGKIYPVEEIKLLLSSKDPSSSINERSDAAGFVDFRPDENHYRWKGRFKSRFAQKHGVKWYYFWYFITAFFGLIPVYIKGISALGELPMIAFSGSLLLIAIMCLVAAENFKAAKKLMGKFGTDA
tara:strand:+ start:5599 stop:6162 length:564 start_codon:yes stop_codon:yes gene_type:complete